jgi:hypothetical protein
MKLGIVSGNHDNMPLIINFGECSGWLYGKSTLVTLDLETMAHTVHAL